MFKRLFQIRSRIGWSELVGQVKGRGIAATDALLWTSSDEPLLTRASGARFTPCRKKCVKLRRRRDHIAGRRIGIETIETRVMLSASMPAVSTASFQLNFFTLQDRTAGFAPIQTGPPSADDGGYINLPTPVTSASNPVLSNGTSQYGSVLQRSDTEVRTNSLGSSVSWGDSGHDFVPSLPALIILPSDRQFRLATPTGPIPAPETYPGENSGGPIRIEPIMKQVGKSSSEVKLTPPATGVSPDTAASELRISPACWKATDSGMLSGEWARAMIFEAAGGEMDTRKTANNPHTAEHTSYDAKPVATLGISDSEYVASRKAIVVASPGNESRADRMPGVGSAEAARNSPFSDPNNPLALNGSLLVRSGRLR